MSDTRQTPPTVGFTLIPVQTVCPHCASHRVEAMRDQVYEAASSVTWYQCRDCRRMWSLPKPVFSASASTDNDKLPGSS